jgi:hypothetical protein
MKTMVAFLFLSWLSVGAAFAAPTEVEKLATEMDRDGANVRAAYTPQLGIYVIGIGTARVTETPARAQEAARLQAIEAIASYLGTQVESAKKQESEEKADDKNAETHEYYSAMIKVNVREMLKGVQTLRSKKEEEEIKVIVYATAKSIDASAKLKEAMSKTNDDGTVEAVGEATSRDMALQKALRSAVEQVIGALVVGESKVSDNEALKQKIFSGAEGFVDTYRITAEKEIAIGVRIEVVAKVSKKKLLDSYANYMKTLGDPTFYIESNSEALSTRFTQFFTNLGIKIAPTMDEASFLIRCSGDFRTVKHPANGRTGTQLSLSFRIQEIHGKEDLVAMMNDARKSACFIGADPERQKELCAEKAFTQMKEPLHEAIHKMVAKMMSRHVEESMNQE